MQESNSSILVNDFKLIGDFRYVLNRAIFINYIVLDCRRPQAHLSQVMKQMFVHNNKFTTEETKIKRRLKPCKYTL